MYEKFILATPQGHFYNTAGGNPHLGGLRTLNDKGSQVKLKHIRKRDYWLATVGNNSRAKKVTLISDPMISYTTGAKQVVVATLVARENSLRDGEERFSLAMRGSNDVLWDWDIKNDYLYLSPKWKSMLGYEDSEIDANFEGWKKLIHSDNVERVIEYLSKFIESTDQNYEVEIRLKHKKGH